MGTLIESLKIGAGGTLGYRLIDYFAGPTQDERLRSKDRQTDLFYRRERDERKDSISKQALSAQKYENYANREFTEEQNRENRRHQIALQESINSSNEKIAEIDSETRMYEADQARSAIEASNRTQIEIATADFNLRNQHHQERLEHESDIVSRQINAQENIARQSRELERYLSERRILSDKEIARFKALAARETQVLVARENASNIMRDRFVQEALRHFPLNVSPIVLLRNRPHTLARLLSFTQDPAVSNTSIEEVYEEVSEYALNPEALNVFITPVQIGSKIKNQNILSAQLWDSIYQKIESFFSTHYNRNSESPVILYPTAWKKDAVTGCHACETLYYFLRDMPCFVLEPRFDGRRFSIIVSAWGLGYETDEHVRSEIEFDIDIDLMLIKAAYQRSERAFHLMESIKDELNDRQMIKLEQLRHNIAIYKALDMDSGNVDMSEINALDPYELFHIEPAKDLYGIVDHITRHINIVLAILADIHHLMSTDAEIRFPAVFKSGFPEMFEDKELRERVFRWYEKVYIRLRNKDNRHLSEAQQKEVAKIREAQIRNLAYTLALIDKESLYSEIDKAISDYALEHHGFQSDDIEEIWWKCIDAMTIDEIDFFEKIKEQLPRTDKRRRRIVSKISDLKNS